MKPDLSSNYNLYKACVAKPELVTAYSDGSELFCNPNKPRFGERVKIRFRGLTGLVFNVSLVVYGKTISMKEISKEGRFSFFEAEIAISKHITYYYFVFSTLDGVFSYGKNKVTKEIRDEERFEIIADFHIPKWACGTRMYQIFTDRFYNGNKNNDVLNGEYSYIDRPVHHQDNWYAYPESFDVGNFYGGDLQGIFQKLDYLQELGVEVLYLNPIFVSPSNHKYDTQDYEHVDPHLAVIVNDKKENYNFCSNNNNNADLYKQRVTDKENLEASDKYFAQFMEEVHRRGMKVILDGVFNHCGSFNKWMDREGLYEDTNEGAGAFAHKDSPYREYFYFDDDTYLGWWNHNTLPKLRYEKDKALYNEILRIAKKWIAPPYNVDGWRLDVAADLGADDESNRSFWRDFRKAIKEVNSEAVILAEHYGDARPWLDGTMWDSLMNYDAFMEPVTWFLTGLEKHSDYSDFSLKNNIPHFWYTMVNAGIKFPYVALEAAMNELSNHDHSRFLTRTSGISGRISTVGAGTASFRVNHAIMRSAVMIQYTWVGNPTIYYGDEAALCGFTDPDNRRTYPWGREDQVMLDFHKDMSRIYEKYPMLRNASLTRIPCTDNALLVYGRFNNEEQLIVIVNNTESDINSNINLWPVQITGEEDLYRLICSYEIGYHKRPAKYTAKNGIINIIVSPHSSLILYHGDNVDLEVEDEGSSK